MLGAVVDLINSFFLGAFLSTGTIYFLAGTESFRASTAHNRAARKALERAMRDNT